MEYSAVYCIGLDQPWPICLVFDVSCLLLDFCLDFCPVFLSMKVWTVINKNFKWMCRFAIGIMKKNVAQSVYYDSWFLQKLNAVNLKEEILNAFEGLDMGKFLHLGMDGPSTNWNVLNLINDHQVANGFQKTLHIGSCSLHILHRAFQTGMIRPGWDICKIFKALYEMSHLLAAIYICVNGHPKYFQ